MSSEAILNRCKEGINEWQRAFNQQDAAACAGQYTEDARMNARPFGRFTGREEITEFWQGIIDQGFAEVEYTDVKWEAIGENGYILTAKWRMNKAFGCVHREHWILDSDGKARLVSDDFEVQGER